jgi:hypothetical protein
VEVLVVVDPVVVAPVGKVVVVEAGVVGIVVEVEVGVGVGAEGIVVVVVGVVVVGIVVVVVEVVVVGNHLEQHQFVQYLGQLLDEAELVVVVHVVGVVEVVGLVRRVVLHERRHMQLGLGQLQHFRQ